jgi:HAD superfamily hydrolase (TIGR01509 family)
VTRRPRAVLWDLDGTIADSKELHWRAWRETMLLGGVEITYEQFLHSFGQRNDAILGAWLPGAPPERAERLGDAKEEAFRRLAAEGPLRALPGALEWIERLAREGWMQAIASSAPRANVETMARALKLERVMGALVSADDVHRGKPDPEVFLVSAERLGVEPARSVVVEDAAAGIEAARRGGMKSIGAGGDSLRAADVVVSSLADLAAGAFDRLVPAD